MKTLQQLQKIGMDFEIIGEDTKRSIEWISVKVRLPELWREVLVYDIFEKTKIDFIMMDGNFAMTKGATHWMPLPEPPTGGKE